VTQARTAGVLVVVAHPDDEVIGFAAGLRDRSDAHVAFLTDGAPRDAAYFTTPFPSRAAYAARRRAEAHAVARALHLHADALHFLAAPDMEAYREIEPLRDQLLAVIDSCRPHAIWSPAYDGGHPDHDVAAFLAAHVARARTLPHFQFALYREAHGIAPFAFADGDPGHERQLSASEQCEKQKLFSIYASQAPVLEQFACDRERYRVACAHDFRARPTAAPTLYEQWGWPVRAETLIEAFAALGDAQ
jgi:N-acetylglucosamine malate deacetylase 2